MEKNVFVKTIKMKYTLRPIEVIKSSRSINKQKKTRTMPHMQPGCHLSIFKNIILCFLFTSLARLRQSHTHHFFSAHHQIAIGVSLFHLIRLYDLIFDPSGVVGQDLQNGLIGHENISCC